MLEFWRRLFDDVTTITAGLWKFDQINTKRLAQRLDAVFDFG
jgi:hypothetical protein